MYALMSATAAKLAALRGEAAKALALATEAEEIGPPVGARPVLATRHVPVGTAHDGGHLRLGHRHVTPEPGPAARLASCSC